MVVQQREYRVMCLNGGFRVGGSGDALCLWDSLRRAFISPSPDFDTFTRRPCLSPPPPRRPPSKQPSPRSTTLHITGRNERSAAEEGIPRTSLTVAVIEYAISGEGAERESE